MNRFRFLLKLSFSYIKQYGLIGFLSRLKSRVSREVIRRIHRPSSNRYEGLYSSLMNTASNQNTAEYVPISYEDFPIKLAPVKLIAFYLPQFHPIPENDEWWGKGFTEWTNVSKAVPQFVGHYQPRLPGELGFYDLRVPEVQKRQVELARKYGIYGFAFYYYWFNGKRLLEKPIDLFVSNKENKFPFCIFWANENWTRRWDGKEDDILIGQDHSPESDFAFIRDIEAFLRDERYIRINDKPMILVYRVQLLPEPKETARRWRDYCREVGIGEIYLIAGQVYGFEDPREVGFDAALEFPPHNFKADRINNSTKILNPAYLGHIYRYPDLADFYTQEKKDPPYELFKTVSPSWDNEPRKPGRGSTFAYSTPYAYQNWIKSACLYALKKEKDQRIVFINAWNEWGEGAYLEPDRRFGYAYLQATRNAISSAADPESKPILVFQMGKVGSVSVASSLSKCGLPTSLFHVHWLNNLEKKESEVLRVFANTEHMLQHIQEAKSLRYAIDNFPSEFKWNVITMVRDPVARNISAFFQAAPDLIPNFREAYDRGEITFDILYEYFKQNIDSGNWFNDQFRPVFNIDLLDIPFPIEQGYEIYQAPKAKILLMRLEDMNRVIKQAMENFLGIENFILIDKNKGEEKYYGDLYKIFQTYPLPRDYVDAMYSKTWVRHFYSAKEIEAYKKYWLKV